MRSGSIVWLCFFALLSLLCSLIVVCISVKQHFGTWYPIDQAEIDGKTYFLLEHEEYGDEAANIIVDEKGILYAQDVYDGFSPEIMDTLHMVATPIGVMPDPSVSVEDMEKYGYTYLGMVPMGQMRQANISSRAA